MKKGLTEEEWLACDDCQPLLGYLHGKVGERKFRLTECAFLRRFWHLLTDRRSRRAVEAAERYAEGLIGMKELRAARARADAAFTSLLKAHLPDFPEGGPFRPYYGGCVSAAQHAASSFFDLPGSFAANPGKFRNISNLAWISTCAHPLDVGADEPARLTANAAIRSEQAAQADLLRDLFGNPFRPVTLHPSWLTADVLSLARAAYQERTLPSGTLDPARLALLGDALEEAGGPDEVLAHLRGPGPHVRGCWVVDRILGKE